MWPVLSPPDLCTFTSLSCQLRRAFPTILPGTLPTLPSRLNSGDSSGDFMSLSRKVRCSSLCSYQTLSVSLHSIHATVLRLLVYLPIHPSPAKCLVFIFEGRYLFFLIHLCLPQNPNTAWCKLPTFNKCQINK